MMSKFKTLCAVFLALTVIGGCATSSSIVPGNSILSIDNSRNVLSFADTLDSVLPSVVRIGSVKRNSDGEVALSGIGSGAVINTEKGYIITNAHVIADAAGVLVNLPDGRTVQARLIGLDTPTDIAVLQADGLNIEAVKSANSDNLRVGDIVFAVGYPLGLDPVSYTHLTLPTIYSV